MVGSREIRALGHKSDGAGVANAAPAAEDTSAETLDLAETWIEDEANLVPSVRRFGWLAPTLALVTVGAWTGFFAWAHLSAIARGVPPTQWAEWIVAWAVPVALVGIVWLLTMRSSRAEAHRFSATAVAMNRESATLEARLKVINRELSLAREFLAAQTRDLDALGRIAAERLSVHAGELQALIATNGAQVDAIGSASETALGNMNQLRNDLPVIANAARDVANQIGSAGHIAEDRLARLGGGFDRLSHAESKGEEKVERLSAQVSQTLEQFEGQLARIELLVTQRLAAAAKATEDLGARFGEAGQTAQASFGAAIAALHDTMVEKLRLVERIDRETGAATGERMHQLRDEAERIDAQLADRNRQFDELIEQRRAAIETHETQARELLTQQFTALDDALAERRGAQLVESEKLRTHGEALSGRLIEIERLFSTVEATSQAARESLAAGLGTLTQQLEEKRVALAASEAQMAQLTDHSVRLLEILQAGARTCREDLAGAITGANTLLSGVEERANTVKALMLRSTVASSDMSDYMIRTKAEIDAAEAAIAGFKSRLSEGTDEAHAQLQGLRSGITRLAEETGALAGETSETLGWLETALAGAFATLNHAARERLMVLAGELGNQAVEVFERALRDEAAATLDKLEQSAVHASGVGREAAIQLRDQLVKVNELTGNLEQRVARARELAEEQVNSDFARRMALITDSLNSAAIDISGALSSEVSDTAWDAYLKGDRGIFTRRAVRLIDHGTIKDIAVLYNEDEAFRGNVGRYIHDFEAMLRQTLSTRDGHVLSVTMLGSDMGKLYVALAQSIERFRT
ncbi:MAG: ATPase [Erythrobacter sp.]